MSTDQPQGDDPFKKRPPDPEPSPPPPYPGSGAGGGTTGGPYGGGGGGPQGGGPYGAGGGGPYGGGGPGSPYGDQYGAADPLAGMPPLASRFRRLIARIVDGLIISIPVSTVFSLANSYDPWKDQGKSTGLSIIIALVYFLYEGLMLTTRGQTLGKMLLKIRVAMLDNGAIPEGRPGWTRAAVYSLPQIVTCCGFVFWLVNVLWCTWDEPYHQCIHDKAAKTVVVSTVQ
ncbi:RDD family protein [Streptomyces sp. NPDC026206]|uniref:RDD family protein n=1 Tax=Streptomyces sp. NPDC026206 TaxID=3157089 RepID=UPI0034053BD2